MVGELSGDTADFLNEVPWFDGIIYILILIITMITLVGSLTIFIFQKKKDM